MADWFSSPLVFQQRYGMGPLNRASARRCTLLVLPVLYVLPTLYQRSWLVWCPMAVPTPHTPVIHPSTYFILFYFIGGALFHFITVVFHFITDFHSFVYPSKNLKARIFFFLSFFLSPSYYFIIKYYWLIVVSRSYYLFYIFHYSFTIRQEGGVGGGDK